MFFVMESGPRGPSGRLEERRRRCVSGRFGAFLLEFPRFFMGFSEEFRLERRLDSSELRAAPLGEVLRGPGGLRPHHGAGADPGEIYSYTAS